MIAILITTTVYTGIFGVNIESEKLTMLRSPPERWLKNKSPTSPLERWLKNKSTT